MHFQAKNTSKNSHYHTPKYQKKKIYNSILSTIKQCCFFFFLFIYLCWFRHGLTSFLKFYKINQFLLNQYILNLTLKLTESKFK